MSPTLESTLAPLAAFTSAFLAGGMNLVSMLAIPLILSTTPPNTPLLLRQWHFIFNSGHKLGPKLAVASGLVYFATAWAARERGAKVIALYAASGLVTMGMVPFTWAFILRTNSKLFIEIEKEKAGGEVEQAKVEGLVRKWRGLNVARTGFPVLGALLGLGTVCGVWA